MCIRDRDGMPQEIADMMIAEIPPEQTMWVISNENGINGAASMLYENEMCIRDRSGTGGLYADTAEDYVLRFDSIN